MYKESAVWTGLVCLVIMLILLFVLGIAFGHGFSSVSIFWFGMCMMVFGMAAGVAVASTYWGRR